MTATLETGRSFLDEEAFGNGINRDIIINVSGGKLYLMLNNNEGNKFAKKKKSKIRSWFSKVFRKFHTQPERLSIPCSVDAQSERFSIPHQETCPPSKGEDDSVEKETKIRENSNNQSEEAEIESSVGNGTLDCPSVRWNSNDKVMAKHSVEEQACQSHILSHKTEKLDRPRKRDSCPVSLHREFSRNEGYLPVYESDFINSEICDDSKADILEITECKQIQECEEDLHRSINLHLSTDEETGRKLRFDNLKPFSGNTTSDEFANDLNRGMNVERSSSEYGVIEKTMTSGYPVKTLSSSVCHNSSQLLSDNSSSYQAQGTIPTSVVNEDSNYNFDHVSLQTSQTLSENKYTPHASPQCNEKQNIDGSVTNSIDICQSLNENTDKEHAEKDNEVVDEGYVNQRDAMKVTWDETKTLMLVPVYEGMQMEFALFEKESLILSFVSVYRYTPSPILRDWHLGETKMAHDIENQHSDDHAEHEYGVKDMNEFKEIGYSHWNYFLSMLLTRFIHAMWSEVYKQNIDRKLWLQLLFKSQNLHCITLMNLSECSMPYQVCFHGQVPCLQYYRMIKGKCTVDAMEVRPARVDARRIDYLAEMVMPNRISLCWKDVDINCLENTKFSKSLVVIREKSRKLDEKKREGFSVCIIPSFDNVTLVQETKNECKKKKRKKQLRKRSSKELKTAEWSHSENRWSSGVYSWHASLSGDFSCPIGGYRFSGNRRTSRPSRKNRNKKSNEPSQSDKSDIKLASSIKADSGIGSIENSLTEESQIINSYNETNPTLSFKSSRMMKISYYFKRQCNTFFRKQQKKKIKSLVAELHIEDRYIGQIFGLGSYFDRLSNGPPSLQEQMRYEWLRLASFQHYRGDGNALHLARHGFYHRQTDGPTTTRCVYCDTTYSNWQYFDDIERTHRQISPDCPFHRGSLDESINVSINSDGPPSTDAARSHQNSNSQSSSSENSAVKTSTESGSLAQGSLITENVTLDVSEITKGLEATHVSHAKAGNSHVESVPQQPSEDPEGNERPLNQPQGQAGTISNDDLPPMPQRSTSRGSGQHAANANGNFNDPIRKHATRIPPPNNNNNGGAPEALENVKHPEYRTMTQRVNSFNGFPDYLDQTPEQMALAGFYFVGVADFTRCFCCGGGLRNWEAGDDPLLEHTRWFPQCEYVRRLKGERYVAAVQRRHQEHMEEQRRQQLEIANQRDANRNPPDPMTTDAAQVMREMGYNDQKIRETILAARRDIGTHLITSQQVLSWLLDHDNNDTRTRSTYNNENDTSSIYTGINMTSDRDDLSDTNFVTAQSSLNPPPSTTALKTNDTLQTSGAREGSDNTNTKSSNQQTAQKSGASNASGQTGLKKTGKKKKGKSATSDQTPGAKSSPGGETAKKLQAENEKLRDMQTCKICMERVVNTTLLPCGHLVCCDICASRLRDCPICRNRIKGTVKTFMS